MDCPRCSLTIPDDSQACPFCECALPARPIKPPEHPEGYDVFAAEAEAPKPPPAAEAPAPAEPGPGVPKASLARVAALVLLAALALGSGFFYLRPMFVRTPALEAPAPPPEAAAPKPEPAASPAPREEAPRAAEPPPSAVEPSTAPAAAAAEASTAPARAQGPVVWEFHGKVYDLLSFGPVSGADMDFISEDGSLSVLTRSGKDGRFRVRLRAPDGGGYRLVIDHPDYATEPFVDTGGRYRRMTLRARAALRNSNLRNPVWKGGEGPRRVDLALFPLVPAGR